MRMIFGTRMSEDDMKTLQEKIFEEADQGEKGYLEQEDI